MKEKVDIESAVLLHSDTKKEDKNNNIVIKFKKEKDKINLENYKNDSGNKPLNSNVVIYGLNNKNENDKLSICSNRNKKLAKVDKNFNLNFHLDKNNKNVNNLNESLENKDENKIIEKITINKFLVYLCFCCVRNTKNLKNFLLDEGMNIIMEELEIFNVFTKLFLEKKIHNDYNIELSDKLTKQLDELYKERIFDIN